MTSVVSAAATSMLHTPPSSSCSSCTTELLSATFGSHYLTDDECIERGDDDKGEEGIENSIYPRPHLLYEKFKAISSSTPHLSHPAASVIVAVIGQRNSVIFIAISSDVSSDEEMEVDGTEHAEQDENNEASS